MGQIERFPLRPANDNEDTRERQELFFRTPLTPENLSERLPYLTEWFSLARIPDEASSALAQATAEAALLSERHLIEYINELLPVLLRDSPAYRAIRDDVTLRVTAAIAALTN
jgi:hypothetical protein